MTHRVVTVMVEPEHLGNQEAIDQRIAAMMAPYSEHLDVDPYERPCWCVEWDDFDSDDCEDCEGSGTVLTTNNPNGKWDYYMPINGMWDISVDDLPDRETYAILSPEGGWQSKGRLGWWGISSDDQPDWPETFRRVFEINVTCGSQPVLLDYHH